MKRNMPSRKEKRVSSTTNELKKQKNIKSSRYFLFCLIATLSLSVCFSYFVMHFTSTQCFARIIPNTPNHGLNEIPVVETITNEELQENVNKGYPVVVTKQMNKWPAMKHWENLIYFKEACPHFHAFGTTIGDYIDHLVDIEKHINENLTPEEA